MYSSITEDDFIHISRRPQTKKRNIIWKQLSKSNTEKYTSLECEFISTRTSEFTYNVYMFVVYTILPTNRKVSNGKTKTLANNITYQAEWFIDLNIGSTMEPPCSNQYGVPWPEWFLRSRD